MQDISSNDGRSMTRIGAELLLFGAASPLSFTVFFRQPLPSCTVPPLSSAHETVGGITASLLEPSFLLLSSSCTALSHQRRDRANDARPCAVFHGVLPTLPVNVACSPIRTALTVCQALASHGQLKGCVYRARGHSLSRGGKLRHAVNTTEEGWPH